jgi:hypothetical protein
MRCRRTASSLIAIATFVLVGCSSSPSDTRAIVRNNSANSQHVFYCANTPCTRGLGGNDVELKPGEEVRDYWNSPDPTGPVGVASSPGDLLLGCLDDPNAGQDAPPTATLLTSQVTPCPGQQSGTQPHIAIVNP